MSRPIALPRPKRRRGNPNWGKVIPHVPALLTEFEMEAKRLGLTKTEYVYSWQLRRWCERNRNRCFVPEWLLQEWRLTVDLTYSGVV